jgi:hypothetical protein
VATGFVSNLAAGGKPAVRALVQLVVNGSYRVHTCLHRGRDALRACGRAQSWSRERIARDSQDSVPGRPSQG